MKGFGAKARSILEANGVGGIDAVRIACELEAAALSHYTGVDIPTLRPAAPDFSGDPIHFPPSGLGGGSWF